MAHKTQVGAAPIEPAGPLDTGSEAPMPDDKVGPPMTFVRLVATRAAESLGAVAKRANLTDYEREAFTTTEHVCADIAVGRRS